MFAVSLASSSIGWVGLALALAVVGALGLLCPRSRQLTLGLCVAGLLVYTANVRFNCPPFWRYLGVC